MEKRFQVALEERRATTTKKITTEAVQESRMRLAHLQRTATVAIATVIVEVEAEVENLVELQVVC